jgi:methylthioxylose transferase
VIASPVTEVPDRCAPPRRKAWAAGAGLVAWAGVIVAAHLWGRGLPAAHLPTPPLFASYDPRVNIGLLPAIVLAAAAAVWAVRIAAATPWRRLLVWTFGAGVAWAVALAVLDGAHALTAPLLLPDEYLASLPFVGHPGHFLATFTHEISGYSTHVRGHPPGMILIAWLLRSVKLGSPAVLAAVVVAAGAAAAPAALVAARSVCGEGVARRAAPFLALAPTAVWIATSADALYAGVGAWAVALLVLATGTDRRRSDLLALGGGILFGAALFLSYGLALLGLVPLAVAFVRRRVRPLAVAAVGVAAVVAAFAFAGFWWPSGLAATRVEYLKGWGGVRPYGYFLLADLAALGVALGPACAAGLARLGQLAAGSSPSAWLRERSPWLLPAAAALAVLAADVSGFSKGEVERIWLPFTPWLLLATGSLGPSSPGSAARGSERAARGWLVVNLAAGLLVQALFVSRW